MEIFLDKNFNNIIIGLSVLIVIWTFVSRINKVTKEYNKSDNNKDKTNPYQNFLNPIVGEIDKIKKMDWLEYKTQYSRLNELKEKVKFYAESELKKLTPPEVKWYEFEIFMEKDKVDKIHSHENNQVVLKDYSKQMEDLLIYNLGSEKKHDYYYYRDKNFRNLATSHKSWEAAKYKYDQAIHEINEAQSAISGAQGVEIFDLLSTNKAVSIASTVMTSSANSEIREVKSAVEELMSYLKTLKADEEVKYKNINVDDFFDLAIDLICDFSFDFSSVMSLFNLSDAEGELNSLERSLQPLGNKIDNLVNQSEELKNKYLSKLD